MDSPFDFRRRLLVWALQLSDVAALLGSMLWVHSWGLGASAPGSPEAELSTGGFALWLLGSALLARLAFATGDLYDSHRLNRGEGELRDLMLALPLGIALSSGLGVALQVPGLTLGWMVGAWACASAVVAASRLALRALLAQLRRSGRNLRQLLVVGGGERAHRMVEELSHQPDLGYRVLGMVTAGESGGSMAGVPVLGSVDEIDRILAENVVDEVIVSLAMEPECCGQIAQVVHSCERQGIPLSLPLDLFETQLPAVRVDMVNRAPFLRYAAHRVTGFPALLKRWIDVAVSAGLLALLAPLFAIVALGVRLSSPGPVFFVQRRVGLHKRTFPLIKFRTMVADAEAQMHHLEHLNEADGPVFKIRRDPRITRIGAVLRRLSIDELPQLINVLRGDMSLVGPRPLPLRDVSRFSDDWLRRRFSVKPGITCFWQVGGRSSTTFDTWMALDMRYIEEWSLALDLKILLQTVPAVVRGIGAH